MRTLLTQFLSFRFLDFRFQLRKAKALIFNHKSSIVNYLIGFDT